MLQVARLAPNLLRDSADLVAEFVLNQVHPSGGFVDRAGNPDVYYSVFGVECLRALRREPPEGFAAWLSTFGVGEALNLIHLTCLARCWSDVGQVPEPLKHRVVEQLAAARTSDGGYSTDGQEHGSAYGCFLATGAHQDVGANVPDIAGVQRCLEGLACGDGSYANDPTMRMGNTPATAAAVTLQHQLGLPIDPRSREWLLAAHHEDGGFFALPGAPMPDLLSTAVALHALAAMHTDLSPIREKCLDFIDTLWVNRGSFHGNWAEETLDVEYTYYGLLALGHLAV
jgi:hypothetical protein